MKRNYVWRYVAIAAIFCLVAVIYLGRLFYIQVAGRENGYQTGTTTRRVIIQASRGEIFDRNGRALVKNQYSYDLTLIGSAFATMDAHKSNAVCLQVLEALAQNGEQDKHAEKYFPFSGAYPYYDWNDDATGADTKVYYRLKRVLNRLDLPEDATVQDVVDHYVRTYGLLSTDPNGVRRYDDDQVDLLIRMRYDMDALDFSTANDYTVAEDVGLQLITYVEELNLNGATFTADVSRVYCYPGYASHILGTVGPIYSEEWEYYSNQGYQMNAIVGKSGCEEAFEAHLHGSDGILLIEEDTAGNVVSVTIEKEPVPGNDVYLTIDIDLQKAAEDGLAENVAYVVNRSGGSASRGAGCDSGAAVAMDPDTFEILAIASYPTYDLSTYNRDYNDLIADESTPLVNRALSGIYAPGSTFKPGVAAAGMLAGVIDSSSTLYCGGIYTRFSDYQPKCATYGASHRGYINAQTAIAVSCNCFFYELGYQMGIDHLESYMTALGFGQSTGIELWESTGTLAGPTYRQTIHGATWQPGDTLSAAIGQSDTQATPLQLACYMATLANGGTRYSAHLLKAVYPLGASQPSTVYTQTESTVKGRLNLSESIRASIFAGMREMVVTHSTASRNFASIPVEVGGKTGTAQTSTDCENALFVGTAPYDDPEIVISVVLAQGYSGEYATLTAARILEQYYHVTDDN
ncbi:MAG: hypothetical protein IJX62_07045 [Clostridia bacterium]|nr:hypothetical protein [Clostridia bacterium]